MPVFAVEYVYADSSEEVRREHRPAHRAWLTALGVPGPVQVLATGPFADGPAGALIIVAGTDRATVESVFDSDPFAGVGAITDRSVREWTQVVGPWAG